MKSQELTITIRSTKDASDAGEIILASFTAFLKKEIQILADSPRFVV
ncbi:hypothetical protein AALC17_08365 [Oscillospiraceae bacterium 38-13]